VITRYGFERLPRPPEQVWLSVVAWNWDSMNEARFRALVDNYGRFMTAHSRPGSPYSALFSLLKLTHRSAGQIVLVTQVSGKSELLLDAFLADLSQGVGTPDSQTNRQMPWLQATQTLNGSGPNQRGKYKSAYMLSPFPHEQITAIYAALNDSSYQNPQALLQVDSYGCQINTRSPTATAVPQRSSIMKLQYQTYWTDPAEDDVNLAWIRRFYQSVYARTGGTPVPNRVTDGCYVNYPDVDLENWPALYYKQNYRQLQRVKARWDPNNIFHYSQSIRRP
jgi:FAD/FMN-containing dehydrogenase